MLRSVWSRIPLAARRAPAVRNPAVVHMHRVRVSKGQVLKRVFYSSIAAYISWKVLEGSVLSPMLRRIAEELEKVDMDEEEADYEDWYVPLPVFETVRRPPYSRSSPEWKRFAEFMKGTPEMLQQRETVAASVRNLVWAVANDNPSIKSKYGRLHGAISAQLTFSFPAQPPPHIIQLGWVPFPLDGGPSFRTRRTDVRHWKRTVKTFWPTHTTFASLAFLRTLFEGTIADGRAALGYPPLPPQESVTLRIPTLPQLPVFRPGGTKADDEESAQSSGRKGPDGREAPPIPDASRTHSPPNRGSEPRASADAPPGASGTADRPLPKAAGSPDVGAPGLGGQKQEEQARRIQEQTPDQDGEENDKQHLPFYKRVPPPTAIVGKETRDRAFSSFVQEFTRRHRPTVELPPDGCVEVSGFVYVTSDLYRLQLEVSAHYNLAKRELDTDSMFIGVRRVMPLRALRP